MTPVVSPIPQYFDLDGAPLDDGRLYFGQPSQNPETAPVVVYWDAAGTQPAAQPIRTRNGYAYRGGSPAQLFSSADFSLSIRNRQGALVAYVPSANVPAGPASRSQTFTENGTFIVPAGVTSIEVSACAGGGGGGSGGGAVGSNYGSGGGGGGAGESIQKKVFSVTPGQSIPIVRGTPGVGGVVNGAGAAGNPGTAGGNTLVGSLVTLDGGDGGQGGASATSSPAGGSNGAGYPSGGAGNDGGAAGLGAGGAGGGSPFGGGGAGGRAGANGGVSGGNSYGYGGGGGGGGGSYSPGTGNGGAGGNGSPGFVVIEW